VTVHFVPQAETDFAVIVEYLAERNPTAALNLGDRIFTVIDKLAREEFDGPEQTLVSGEVVRSWSVPPVRVYYQRQSRALWILHIYHQAQRPIVK